MFVYMTGIKIQVNFISEVMYRIVISGTISDTVRVYARFRFYVLTGKQNIDSSSSCSSSDEEIIVMLNDKTLGNR